VDCSKKEIEMKKLLILAYDFPPYVSVGGLRPYNWYRYLKAFDVEPIVITRQWGNVHGNHLDYIAAGSSDQDIVEESEFGTIIRTPYHPNFANRLMLKHGEKKHRILRKSVSAYYEFAQFLAPVGPKAGLFEGARAYLKTHKVDAIIATGDPFVLFYYASKLSKEFGIPWIADYRDTWVQDKTRSGNAFSKSWNSFFEKKFLKNVSAITTVSSFIVKQLRQNIQNESFDILLNGFNPDTINSAQSIPQQSQEFIISFAGTIYKWHPIDLFLSACQSLILEGKIPNFKINFYGVNIHAELKENITQHYPALLNKINLFPKTENDLLVKELAISNLFLLFNDYSILGTKIFTYLGLKRKILLCFSKDENALTLKDKFYNLEEFDTESKQLQADLIQETNSGIIVKDSHHLQQVLQELYTEFEEKGFIACDSVGVENYSRKIQVEKLAELVKEVGG
jgi:glycosyltransferase involved in cell wall biosynthesis